MDTLFLTILAIIAMCSVIAFLGIIEWVLMRITRAHLYILTSLSSTLGLLWMFGYALWTTFGWWCLAILAFAFVHGILNSWLLINSVPKNWDSPIYRKTNGRTYGPRIR
jgi:hypothetical protein